MLVLACLGVKRDHFSTHFSEELHGFGRAENLRSAWPRFGSLPAWIGAEVPTPLGGYVPRPGPVR